MSLEQVRQELSRGWEGAPAAKVCLRILDFMESAPADQLNFLTFATLCRAAGRKAVDSDLLAAINILSGSRLALLEPRALLVDEDEREHELPGKEIAEARSTGMLIHPETGEPVADFESHLIPFFAPSERLLAELR